jgi:glycosyltransferase EpsF
MKKVLQIVPTLGYGGVANFVLNYYKKMNKDKIIFDFVTHGKEEAFHKDLIRSGSKIFYFKTIGQVGMKKYYKQLKSILNHNEYNAIHINEGHITGVAALMCKLLGAKKVVCHAHTSACPNRKHTPFMPIFRYLTVKYGDIHLACGEKAAKFTYGNIDYIKINNAIDVKRFCSIQANPSKELKLKYGIDNECFVIGHIGTFIEIKNHSYILRIFSQVAKRKKNTKLVLVGDGVLKDKIIDEAKKLNIINNVIFMGIQTDIPSIINMLDVFLLPSLHEGLPLVGIEAQAAGVPCLFSNTIDKDVDLGMGSVKFLPIDENHVSNWCEEIMSLTNSKVSPEKRTSILQNSGYDVNVEALKLFEIY